MTSKNDPAVSEPTLAASGAGATDSSRDATLLRGGADKSAHEATMASGAGAVQADAGGPAVIIRAGRQEDFPELVTVDPQNYVVGREIARGGMGRIMAARDRRLGRAVAIKELLVKSGELRARFEREARITARLQHPAIVNLLEAGTWPGGEPFYVMKLVSGESLDKVIASRSTREARLSLLPNVIAAVDALAYAHSVRVIHRDLKPANVLVGEFGETVVIDWGLAKDLTDVTGRDEVFAGPYRAPAATSIETMVGEVMGTPAFMPVEQAEGESVDERADVYSLGAMLYHMLAGSPPYTGRSATAILDAVMSGPPPALETRTAGVPPDLLTIVNKAMARAAADRYPTAKELADDLKKFQTGQLVEAHRYSSWQLVRRWLRRHRTAVAIAAIAAILLAVVGVVSLQRIFDEQARTERQRKAALASRAEAEGLSTFMLGDLPKKLKPLGQLEILRDVATKASAYYDSRVDDLSDPELSMRARARRNVGGVMLAQGRSEAALAEQRASLAIVAALAARDPKNLDWQHDLAASHLGVGEVLFAQGNSAAALTEFRAARAIAEALPGGDDREQDVAVIRDHVGQLQLAQGDTAAAVVEFRAALTTYKAQHAAGDGASAERLVTSHNSLGEALVAQGDIAGALAEYRASQAIATQQAAKDRRSTEWQDMLAIAHARVGRILAQQGDASGALAEYRGGFVIAKALSGRDPTNADWQFALNGYHRRIGKALLQQGDSTGALAEYRAGLAISEAMAALDPASSDWQSGLATDHDAIGNVLLRQGDTAGALLEYRGAQAITKTLAAKDPADQRPKKDLVACHNKVGAVAYQMGNTELARAEFAASLDLAKGLAAADPTNADRQRELAAGHSNLGSAMMLAGDLNGALAELRAFHAIAEALAAKDPTNADRQSDLAMSHDSIGEVLLKQGHAVDALASYRAGHSIFEALAAKDATSADRQAGLAGSHHSVGTALAASGDAAAALVAYRSGLAIAKRLLATEPTNADVRAMVTALTRKTGRRPRARR